MTTQPFCSQKGVLVRHKSLAGITHVNGWRRLTLPKGGIVSNFGSIEEPKPVYL